MATMEEEKRRGQIQRGEAGKQAAKNYTPPANGMPVPPATDNRNTSPARSLMGGNEPISRADLSREFGRVMDKAIGSVDPNIKAGYERAGVYGGVGGALKSSWEGSEAFGRGVIDAGKYVGRAVTGSLSSLAEGASPGATTKPTTAAITPAPTADQVTADAAKIADRTKEPYPKAGGSTDPRTPAAALLGGGTETVAPEDRLMGGYGQPAPKEGSYTPRTLGNEDITEARSQPGLNVMPFPTVDQSRELQAQQESLNRAKQAAAYRAMGETPPWERTGPRSDVPMGIGQRDPMIDINRKIAAAQRVFGDPDSRSAERQNALVEIKALQEQGAQIGEQRGGMAKELMSQQGQTQREAMAQQGQTQRDAMKLSAADQAARRQQQQPAQRAQVGGGEDVQSFVREMTTEIMKANPSIEPGEAVNQAMSAADRLYGGGNGGSQQEKLFTGPDGKTYREVGQADGGTEYELVN